MRGLTVGRDAASVAFDVLRERVVARFDDLRVLEATKDSRARPAAYIPLPAGGPPLGIGVVKLHDDRPRCSARAAGRAGNRPETQLVEDAACLVFCEVDLADVLAQIGPDKTAEAIRKTLPKMSAAAIGLGSEATPRGPAFDLLVAAAG